MDGISVQDPTAGLGVGDKGRAVIGVNTDPGGNPRKYTFPSPGIASEKVGFDKAFRNQKIRLGCGSVDNKPAAAGQGIQKDQAVLVVAVVDLDIFFGQDLRAKFCFQLRLGCFPVTSGSDEDGDLGLGIPLADLLSISGRMILLGTGRVWSLAMIVIFCFPWASWRRVGLPIGEAMA